MKFKKTILATSTVMGLLAAQQAIAANPTAVNVTVYKTEACTSSSSCVTILNNTSGVAAELVAGTGAFGNSPSVAAGTYKKLRLTLKNEIAVTGDGDGTGGSCTSSTTNFLIDGTKAATAQVTVAFATSDSSPAGSTGWYANGSETSPLLMSAPVVVQTNGTTNVDVSFNTSGTLSCVSSTNTLAPPTFAVTSQVVPPAASTFTGGEYYLFTTHASPPWFNAESTITANSITLGTGTWPPADITAGTIITPGVANGSSIYEYLLTTHADKDKYAAQLRARTVREYNWGGKVTLGAPGSTTGEGSLTLTRTFGKKRMSAKWGSDDFTDKGTTTISQAVGSYKIDANNRLIITGPDANPMKGAVSTDGKTILVGGIENGVNFAILIKIDPTLDGTLPAQKASFNQYSLRNYRNDATNGDGENGDVNETLHQNFYNSIATIDMVSSPGNTIMQSIGIDQSISNPEKTTFSVSKTVNPDWMTMSGAGPIASMTDGETLLAIGSNASPTPVNTHWLATNGQVGIISSAVKYLPRDTGNATTLVGVTYSGENTNTGQTKQYAHEQMFGVMMKLSAASTHTATALAGTYYLAGLWDESTGASNSSFGAMEGEIILNADGTGSFSAKEVNNLNKVSAQSASFTWALKNGCFGVDNNGTTSNQSDDTMIPFTDADCTIGNNTGLQIQAIEITQSAQTVAVFLPSEDGRTFNFIDPKSFDPANANRRQLGVGVKLK